MNARLAIPLFCALACLAGLHTLAVPDTVRPAVPPPLAGGIQITETDLDHYARAVRGAGLDSIQVTLYARHGRWDSADLSWKPEDAEHVRAEIRAAHARGLRVVLVLRTYLEHSLPENKHLWHGMIWPDDTVLDAWFDAYRDYALAGAALARSEEVEVLVVGNELNSMTSTRTIEELPAPYDYFLDPERTARVRADLVACAGQVPDPALRPELSWLDGHSYPDLEDALLSEEQARRAWALQVTGGDADSPDLQGLGARRERLEGHWRDLIAAVRQEYSGTVVYGANFDQFEQVGFWDSLDAVGVTSYFPLSLWGAEGPEQASQLEDGWRVVAGALDRVARHAAEPSHPPLPVYLLELGWTRKAGCTVRPWSYERVEVLESVGEVPEGGTPPLSCVHWGSQPEDAAERERAMEALLTVVREGSFPTLRGFSLWKITTNAQHREVEPFAIVLPPPRAAGEEPVKSDADTRMLDAAASLGRLLSRPPR